MAIDGIILQICITVLVLATVALHLAKKNANEARLYALQSLAVVGLMAISAMHEQSLGLAAIVVLTFVVKVVLAPLFFVRLIHRHKLRFSAKTYVKTPVALAVLIALFLIASSEIFAPLTALVHGPHTYGVLLITTLLASVFLMVNRRGALSQVIGVLSLENAIVAFALLAGLEQSAALQIGVMFDISVWLVVAVVMVAMVYRHHGTLDVTNMKNLRD